MPRTERSRSADAALEPASVPGPTLTVLRPPRTSLGLVGRHALVASLVGSHAPLVVISAPAGWGKTTLLLQWNDAEARPHAWLTLEASHNDPLALLGDLASAFDGVTPIDPMVAQWIRLAAPPVRERILPSLQGSLGQSPPFLLVLDDAQLLTDSGAWQIVEVLLHAFPPGAQLAVGTRGEPPLPLARLRAAGGLFRVGSAELAMDVRETAELLERHRVSADARMAEALQAVTEGWATGIALAAIASGDGVTPDLIADIRGDQVDIARYLTTEVLERQTPHARSFLLQTSILARLSAGLCRAVTGDDNAAATLAALARDNVFLASLDDSGTWYRYHRLFAELLRRELEQDDDLRVAELHGRAAAWCEDHSLPEEAVRHWLAADEVSRAAGIVCRAFTQYTGRGQFETVRLWLDLFTDEQILSDVPLTLTAGWVASMTGDARTGRLWSNAALSERVDDSPVPGGAGTLRAWQAALRATVGADGVRRMRQDAELAATLNAESHPGWRAGSDTLLGVARWLAGDGRRAQQAFRRATEEGSAFNAIAEIGALGWLALELADDDRWTEAQACAEQARRRFAEAELGLIGPMLVVPLAEALVLAHRGEPAAEGELDAVAAALDQVHMPTWAYLATAVTLAQIALERGDLATMERWVASAAATMRAWPDAGILRARLERLRHAAEQRRLADHLTPAERRVLEQLATHLPAADIAQALGVSMNTLKTQTGALFRKLDAHSRSEAVERAHEIGLL